ncbi:MAG: capsid cement protein [Sterolibacterium sp.]|jgi:predicted RecA/RadA family phage recombinase
MASNFIQDGDTVTLTAPAGGVVSGTGYLIGTLFVVALVTAAEGASFDAMVEGVFTLPKTSAQAWAEGQKVFWDNSNHRADSDSTVGQLIGVSVGVAANPTANGSVRLNCGVPAMAEGAQAAVADLSGTLTGTANGSMVDIAATAGACAGGATPTATQVDTAIATAVASIVTGTNEQLKELQTKLNAALAALRAAGVIAS